MPRKSAGLLMYRHRDNHLEFLVGHLGGPIWANKDTWLIPRGEIEAGEDELDAAMREFQEETGLVPSGPFIDLGEIQYKTGKVVRAWAFAGDCDPTTITSNTFTMEWPPNSGKQQSFPEVDQARFVDLKAASEKVHPVEYAFIERLAEIMDVLWQP